MATGISRRNRVGIGTSDDNAVPRDCRSKLMFYLSCMCRVLDLTEYNIGRLTNYHDYEDLSLDDALTLCKICSLVSPEEMERKCLFIDASKCGEDGFKFYIHGAQPSYLVAIEHVVIAETPIRVKCIVYVSRVWIVQFFYLPMTELTMRIKQFIVSRVLHDSGLSNRTNTSTSSDCKCCTIL